MAEELKIHIICGYCKGTGRVSTTVGNPEGNICYICEGTGRFEWGSFANLCPTFKVASCINSTEYQTLVDAAKDGVRVVLSCGFVDMREGQWARTTLFSMFGVNSLTRAALIAMFG